MKILIVDDEYSKVQEIADLIGADINVDFVHVANVNDARTKLRENHFELAIIDLNLPSIIGEKPVNSGGISLFNFIHIDPKINIPSDIIFITGKEECLDTEREVIESHGAILLNYSSVTDSWKKVIIGRLKIAQARHNRKGNALIADIVVITALGTPELDAVLNLPFEWKKFRLENDPITYHQGKIHHNEGYLDIVAASTLRKGMPSSAALATRLASNFKPKYLVMLGICAGIRGKVNLGDIVIADPTWDWGGGKYISDTANSAVFLAAPYQLPLPTSIHQIVASIITDKSTLQSIQASWKGTYPPDGSLSAHIGPMASGAAVVADMDTTKNIISQQRDVLSIEMEAFAVMAASEYSNDPKPTSIIIKSVCDFADKFKDDSWQEYAAYTSASFAHKLFIHPDFLAIAK